MKLTWCHEKHDGQGLAEVIFKLKSTKERENHVKDACKQDRKNKVVCLVRVTGMV